MMNAMTNEILEVIEKRTGYKATVGEVIFKGNVPMTPIVINTGNNAIKPTIYLERFNSIDEMIETITKAVDEADEMYQKIDVNAITDWEYAKERIIPRLRKATYRDDVKRPFLDMEIYYSVFLSEENGQVASTRVDNYLLEKWGVTESDVFEVAKANAEKEAKVISLIDLMMKIKRETCGLLPVEPYDENGAVPMYVITNNQCVNGAASIISTDVMDKVAEYMDGDVIILPSSIHEVIIIKDGTGNYEDLASMVRDINGEYVASEEVLTNSVYVYDREAKEIRIAQQ